MPIGYSAGQPFGDPNGFTRSTGEDEINRFNQWLRSQPFWQQARAINPNGDMNDQQLSMIAKGLKDAGVTPPDNFIIDKAGNFNQTNRLDDIAKWSAIAGAAGLTIAGGLGAGPLAGLLSSGSTVAPSVAALEASAGPLSAAGIPGAAVGLGTGAGTTGLMSTAGKLASKFMTGKGADLLSDVGRGIGAATDAAGNNRLAADESRRRGENDYESHLQDRSILETRERANALDDAYRSSWYQNRQAGPNNTRGVTPMSPEFMNTLSALERQAMEQLANKPTYGTASMPELKKFTPTPQSGLEKAGSWAAPIAGGLSAVARFLRK
jgi:hypothetical protein